MEKLRIGIDVDEVIVEFLEGFLEFYNLRYNGNFKRDDFKTYQFEDTLGGRHEDAVKLVEEFGDTEIFKNLKVVEGSVENIRLLNENHDLVVLTARHPKLKTITEDFLKKIFGDIFLEILYTGEAFVQDGITKADLCKDKEISFMIDDNAVFSKECADKGVKVFLLDKPWNQNHEEHDNIKKVYNWNEILEKIKQNGK